MTAERIGIIDLGTNSVRFDVHQVDDQGDVQRVHRDRIMLRLGQNLFAQGKLDDHAQARTVETFKQFRSIADALNVDRIVALATSALRDAKDSQPLLDRIQQEAAIHVQVISGEEEARLTARGILWKEPTLKDSVALIDIGGGSTEVSLCKDHELTHAYSFDLGVARLQQRYLQHIPPGIEAIETLRKDIHVLLEPIKDHDHWAAVTRILGSSGTVRAFARLFEVEGKPQGFTLNQLSELVEKMSHMEREALLQIPHLEANRVDLILAGGIVLQEIMRVLNTQQVITTMYGLRDGILHMALYG